LRQPWTISIAEDLRSNPWLTKTTRDGGAGFDAQWDDRFVHPICQAIIVADDADRDMAAVASAILASYDGDVFDRVIYTESHDEVANGKARVPEEIAPGGADSLFAKKRAVLGAALVFTSPGIPMIFQGQEFLESGWFDDHQSLDWHKAQQNGGIVKLYRDLIRLRRNKDGQTRGLTGQHTEVFHLDDEKKTLAFRRWELGGPGDDVVVVANFANQTRENVELSFPFPGLWRLRFNSAQQLYDASFDDTPGRDVVAGEENLSITIGPFAVLIYSQDQPESKGSAK